MAQARPLAFARTFPGAHAESQKERFKARRKPGAVQISLQVAPQHLAPTLDWHPKVQLLRSRHLIPTGHIAQVRYAHDNSLSIFKRIDFSDVIFIV